MLSEVHRLIEKYKGTVTFVMTGSSARKLRRSSTDLLGGRAWSYTLFPLTHQELSSSFDLSDTLVFGSLPPLTERSVSHKTRFLKAYTQTYLKEEILQEALVRNIPAFNRFLELSADQSGLAVNYSNIAAETGVSSRTIKQYYQILEDTLIAFPLHPYLKSARKRLTTHPLYYLFDLGVTNALCGRLSISPSPGTSLFGRLFEQFIVLELHRLLKYAEKDWPMFYWRTAHGAEVDVIIQKEDGLLAVEIKSSESVKPRDLRSLNQFLVDYPGAQGVCVCDAPLPYEVGNIRCLPWNLFFQEIRG